MWSISFAKVALPAMGFAKSSQPAMKGLIFDSRFAKPLFPAI